MKKLNISSLLLLLLLPFLAGCSKDEIIFDSQLPRFELRQGYQLLEVIVPQGTLASDKIYIIGEFNGGMDAVGDPRWQLEKALIPMPSGAYTSIPPISSTARHLPTATHSTP